MSVSTSLWNELKALADKAAVRNAKQPIHLGGKLSDSDISRVIEMAWEDRTPFEAIETTYGLAEAAVIALMRQKLKPSSFKLWRKRVSGRKTKHIAMRSPDVSRGYCPTQYKPR